MVDFVCPENITVKAAPGFTATRVNWQEPDLTGWEETNFTSTAFSDDAFTVGSQRVAYQQWFGINNLVLHCVFDILVVGKVLRIILLVQILQEYKFLSYI